MAKRWKYHLRADIEFDDVAELAVHIEQFIKNAHEIDEYQKDDPEYRAHKLLNGETGVSMQAACSHVNGYYGLSIRDVLSEGETRH